MMLSIFDKIIEAESDLSEVDKFLKLLNEDFPRDAELGRQASLVARGLLYKARKVLTDIAQECMDLGEN